MKLNGINRLIIIGLGQKLKEDYNSVKSFFELLNINQLTGVIKHCYSVDFKLMMIMLGKLLFLYCKKV